MAQSQRWQWIPTHLTLEQFEEFQLVAGFPNWVNLSGSP